jgi:hypothetical protein
MGQPSGPLSPMWQPAWAWLKTRNRPEYAEHHVLTGPGGGPVQAIDVAKLSDEDLQKVVDGKYMPEPTRPKKPTDE